MELTTLDDKDYITLVVEDDDGTAFLEHHEVMTITTADQLVEVLAIALRDARALLNEEAAQ